MTVNLAPSIATEAAWLYKAAGRSTRWSTSIATNAPLDEQTNCLATAVYFEARGESLEGQLAVARVVMNRAASGRYPPDWCSVVKQPAQFSFVRHGEFPAVDTDCDAWRKAEAIARARRRQHRAERRHDVLWYHADLCRAVVGPPAEHGREDRRAHLLSRLSRVNLEGRRRFGPHVRAPFSFRRSGCLASAIIAFTGDSQRESIRASIKSRIFRGEFP